MLLAFDTSTRVASVALWHEGVVAEFTWLAGQNQTSELLPAIDRLLVTAGVTLADLTGLGVAKGPGSFNGVRVGVTAAKGLAFSRNLPIVGISTLEAQAFALAACGRPVVAVLPAGHSEFAVAKYQLRRGRWRSVELEQIATTEGLLALAGRQAIITGELAPDLILQLKRSLPSKVTIASPAARLRRAGPLAELASARLARGERDDWSTLQPIYLRRPPITERKAL